MKNWLIARKNSIHDYRKTAFMIIEKQTNADILNAETGGDLWRIIICGIDGGIVEEGWMKKFRKETIVSYSGQSPGICLDLLWNNVITLFLVANVTSKIPTEELWIRVLERVNALTACLRERGLSSDPSSTKLYSTFKSD